MIKPILTACLLFSAVLSAFSQDNSKVYPYDLKCEYLVNPLGIDTENPRLSWKLLDKRDGAVQKSYRVVVDTDSLSVANSKGNIWDTGKVSSDRNLVSFKGKSLAPATKYYWKVIISDIGEESRESKVANFETGKMSRNNWHGAWISDNHDTDYKPAPYFRKSFNVDKKIKSARAYIAVAGLYELSFNGEKAGDHILDPMYTRFDRRTLYVTHDITSLLTNGENAVGVILGNGWYNHQSIGVWDFHNAPWRNRPAFCMDIEIVYQDGTKQIVCTERDWKTGEGSIRFNSIYTAEHQDARMEQKGWNKPGFDDSKWQGVSYRAVPSENIVSQQMKPIRAVDEINPVKVSRFDDKNIVFDFGRNMAGITKIVLSGEAGTVVRVKHGERLYDNGHVDLSNIDVYHRPVDDKDPFQTDIYTLSGDGDEVFMPKFNYKGFRYAEVTADRPVKIADNGLTAYFSHSDVDKIGFISSSNELINKMCFASDNSYLSNLMGYPTDCPQREKNGWTGDGHLAIETALFNFDGITIYEKWLADHRDEQQPNGVLPDIIPTGGWGYGTANGLDWTSTIAIIPWNIYMFYGDNSLLEKCYYNIKNYVDYVNFNYPSGLTSWGRGDWVPVKTQSSLELTSSVYYFVDINILASAAKMFGRMDDYKYYSALAQKVKNAVNDKYLNKETGVYANGSQTELSVPLQWGVTPDDCKDKVAQKLSSAVDGADGHLDVGVLGAKAILNALSNNHQSSQAYRVATQNTYPSWGWWIVNGATTLLENWDLKAERDISDNHMMFGEVGGWYFKGLAGIQPDPENPGFKNIILKPYFPENLGKFSASHVSPYGEIVSKWEKKGGSLIYTITIPANSKADFYLPKEYKLNKIVSQYTGKKIEDISKNDVLISLKAGTYTLYLKKNK
ncbi:MAG: family 78 glycoside hydrolase catalytic domain [Bacteroidales bacterium]|nr:family 78 glycoside hydrolase catalytic domain [Bacteroidales bacterium]